MKIRPPLELRLPQPKKVNERKKNKKPLEDIKDEAEAEMRLASMMLLS
jgi:hypothetical protein